MSPRANEPGAIAGIADRPVVLTPGLAGELVNGAASIALATRCSCREEHRCQSHSSAFGCLYLGRGARDVAAAGNARVIDRQQTLEHLRSATEQGLMLMAFWPEEDAKTTLKLCSCCRCCCISRRIGDGMRVYIDGIIGMGIARAEDGCNACGECERACFFQAIVITEDGPEVCADRCKGCGRCERACGKGLLKVYPLEAVPSFSDGWVMIPAKAVTDEFAKVIR